MSDTMAPRTWTFPRASCPAIDAATRDTWRGVFVSLLGERPVRVLDVASGDGSAALQLAALGHYPHGVDRSPEAVRTARARAAERFASAEFRVGRADDLDFPAASFDAVHARDLLSSLPHPQWALAEWFRVLRPGGRLIVAEIAQPGRRDVAAAQLRVSGFGDVAVREIRCSRHDDRRAGPWYRCLAASRRRWIVTSGKRA